MSIEGLLGTAMSLSTAVFAVTSMLAMGLGLTLAQIAAPLRDGTRVTLALVANFVLVPLLALPIIAVFALDQPQAAGLLVLATAAGGPFLPKLVQSAKGDTAFAVGLMVLLMVVTIVYLPLVLPRLLPGVTVDAVAIARSLVVTILLPLAIGLAIRAWQPGPAARWRPRFAAASSVAILVMLGVGVTMSLATIVALVQTGAILALVAFALASMGIGLLLGGPRTGTRSAMVLGTSFRGVTAALIVATANFAGTPTVPFIIVAAMLLLAIVLPTAAAIGRRQAQAAALGAG
jgi:BASS family bile acid:Na+ symporter